MSRVSGPTTSEKPLFQRLYDGARIVHAKGCLRNVGNGRIERQWQRLDVFYILDEMDGAIDLAKRALNFGVAGMANKNQDTPLPDIAAALIVHFGHQRTGGIQRRQITRSSFILYIARDAVRAENCDGAGRHFIQRLHKPRALGF